MALKQFSDVVWRCQAVQGDNYTTEDHDVFMIAGRTCIEEGESAHVLRIIVDDKHSNIVKCMGWNLLPPLIRVLLKKKDENIPHCRAILKHLLEVGSPKELLLGLLEQVDEARPNSVTDAVLLLWRPLQDVLGRLDAGRRKARSLGTVLCTLLEQAAKLPVPGTKEREEDNDLCRFCTVLRDFIGPFIHEARQNVLRSRNQAPVDGGDCTLPAKEDELRTQLLRFCMKCLSEPLLRVVLTDLDSTEKAASPLRAFAEKIIFSLTQIGESLHNLVLRPVLKGKALPEEEERYPKESLASLAYLQFVHHLAADSFPAVFSPVFLLRCNMEHVNLLSSSTQEICIQKGLELYQQSLLRLEDASVSARLLDIKVFTSVPQNLFKIMTLCPEAHLRAKAVRVFQLSVDKFETGAKYTFLQSMFEISDNPGVQGYIIKNIKNQIHDSLKPGNSNVWFQGTYLLPLLHQVLCLPQGSETDLLDDLDRVMESLNMLRYLVIKDKETDNRTGIWTELPKIEETFLKPLRVRLDVSIAQYEVELRNNMDGKEETNIPEDNSAFSVSVGEEKLPSMTKDKKIEALHSALDTFDMMKSVLVRIEELIGTRSTIE